MKVISEIANLLKQEYKHCLGNFIHGIATFITVFLLINILSGLILIWFPDFRSLGLNQFSINNFLKSLLNGFLAGVSWGFFMNFYLIGNLIINNRKKQG